MADGAALERVALDMQAAPFLKWAGGKRKLCETIARYLPEDMSDRVYHEPFLGGGALFFWLRANRLARQFILSDVNARLVETYQAVQSQPDALREGLRALENARELIGAERHFELVRAAFNADPRLLMPSGVERASWFIYLNRTCFNGLYRTNRAGQFNVPLGRYATAPAIDDDRISRASAALQWADLRCGDYSTAHIRPGDVVYLDPPYVPASKTANFTSYSGAFGETEQRHLAAWASAQRRKGAWVIASNSDTPLVRELYADWKLVEINVRRSVSASGSSRGTAPELMIVGAV